MIQLIMGKIKSKCKINLSRCRGWNQIDAPSVHASKICSPEWRSLAAGAQDAERKPNVQYSEERRFCSCYRVICRWGDCSWAPQTYSCLFKCKMIRNITHLCVM